MEIFEKYLSVFSEDKRIRELLLSTAEKPHNHAGYYSAMGKALERMSEYWVKPNKRHKSFIDPYGTLS